MPFERNINLGVAIDPVLCYSSVREKDFNFRRTP